MTRGAATGPGLAHRTRHRSTPGATRRIRTVLLDLALSAAICVVGFAYLAEPMQRWEAAALARVLGWIAPGRTSGTLPTHVLLFPARGGVIDAVVTASCSSVLSVLGLTALTTAILRGRGLHAVGGLLVAVTALLVTNHLRLLLSALAGLWWGADALVMFHDWVGTVWNLVATLGGFLLMVWVALPPLERAEQDIEGRHSARRPDSWALPGLGYRASEAVRTAPGRGSTLVELLQRRLLPRRVSRRMSSRREAGRIDYRIGHLPVQGRMDRIRELTADGLGVHTASLVAVATYERDTGVLDCLAEAVAARQWEPVTNHRVVALRLWARGWLQARHPVPGPSDLPGAGPARDPLPTVPIARIPVPPRLPIAPTPAAATGPDPARAGGSRGPGSFAHPASPPLPSSPPDLQETSR